MSSQYRPHFGGNPRILCQPANEKALWADGITVPTDGTAGYEHGCFFQDKDGTTGADALFVNIGSKTSCAFRLVQTTTDSVALAATAAEINRSADASSRIVITTATQLSLTVTEHGERIVIINTDSTVTNVFSLPSATGSGVKFTLVNNRLQTQGEISIRTAGVEIMKGLAMAVSNTTTAAGGFYNTVATAITFNRGTKGGLGGDCVELWDEASGLWLVRVDMFGTSSMATPFS